MIVTVLFTAEEHAALLRHLHDSGVGRMRDPGFAFPALETFDLRGAVLAMERATTGAQRRSA